jgi:hypothetical protein
LTQLATSSVEGLANRACSLYNAFIWPLPQCTMRRTLCLLRALRLAYRTPTASTRSLR